MNDTFDDFAKQHRRNILGGEVSFWKANHAAREEHADTATVATWRPLGGGGRIEIKLDAAGRDLLKRIEYALADAFEAGKRAQQKAILEVLGAQST